VHEVEIFFRVETLGYAKRAAMPEVVNQIIESGYVPETLQPTRPGDPRETQSRHRAVVRQISPHFVCVDLFQRDYVHITSAGHPHCEIPSNTGLRALVGTAQVC
jgi:hypothetical protein